MSEHIFTVRINWRHTANNYPKPTNPKPPAKQGIMQTTGDVAIVDRYVASL